MSILRTTGPFLLLGAALAAAPVTAMAQDGARTAELTYADMVDLADEAPLVVRAQIRRQQPSNRNVRRVCSPASSGCISRPAPRR